jgi:hypothetical protein
MKKFYLFAITVIFTIATGECDENTNSIHKPATQAQSLSKQVIVELDKTTVEQLVSQIPFQAKISRGNGEDRVFNWTFDDGSSMIAYFRPHQIINKGLLLHRVEIK